MKTKIFLCLKRNVESRGLCRTIVQGRKSPEERQYDRQVRRRLSENPECPVCFEKYTPVQRALKILTCGHLMCESCWDEIVSTGSQNLRCPLCRAPQPGFEEESNEDTQNVVEVEIVQRGPRLLPRLIILNFPMQTDVRVTRTEFLSSLMPNYPNLFISGFPNEYDIVPVPNQSIYTELVQLFQTRFNDEPFEYATYISMHNQIKFPFTHWSDRNDVSQAVSEILNNHGTLSLTFNIS